MLRTIKKLTILAEDLLKLLSEQAERDRHNQVLLLSLLQGKTHRSTDAPQLYDKNDVTQYLRISEATYYRKVVSGELKPRKINKKHYYFLEDLVAQFEESVRRGRI